jgi:hypothetical protein
LSSAEQEDAASLSTLVDGFTTYERDLDLLGIDDAQVVARYPRGRLRKSVAWSLCKVACAIPVAAIGVLVHIVPFQITKQLSKRPNNEGIKATVKLLGCAVLFSAAYVGLGFAVGHFYGAWAGLTAAIIAPLCGYTAVRLAERVKRIGGLLEGYRTVKRRRGRVLDSVFADRAKVLDAARIVDRTP